MSFLTNMTDWWGLAAEKMTSFFEMEVRKEIRKGQVIKTDNYVSYDICGSFSKEPGDLESCLFCSGSLSMTAINASTAAESAQEGCCIPVHYYSRLFTCHRCHWWYIRENWADVEWGSMWGDYDFIIVGPKPHEISTANNISNALKDAMVYERALPLPLSLWILFSLSGKSH